MSRNESDDKFHAVCDSRDADIVYLLVFAIAAAARSTGFSCRLYIEELDRVLSYMCHDWASKYYQSLVEDTRAERKTNLLSLAIAR